MPLAWHEAMRPNQVASWHRVPLLWNTKSKPHLGFLRTIITESPRRNILLMNLSLLTGRAFFLPFPVFGICNDPKQSWDNNDITRDLEGKNTLITRHNMIGICLWYLGPHFPDIFKNHVAVAVKGPTRPRSFLLFRQLISTWQKLKTFLFQSETKETLRQIFTKMIWCMQLLGWINKWKWENLHQ